MVMAPCKGIERFSKIRLELQVFATNDKYTV